MYTKLPNKPECLGFRKTIVLNMQEVTVLNTLLAEAINYCEENQQDEPRLAMIGIHYEQIKAKLNAPTPPPN